MAAEATFLIRAVDSTKAAFASVQNNLDKLKNESQLAGGFLKKAFDFKQLGMGLAVAAGASLVSIVDKALAQLDEFIKRSETARVGTITAATDADKIFAAGARERMGMEEQLKALKQDEENASKILTRLEKDKTVATRNFLVETKNGYTVLHNEKYRDLNLTKEQQKEYDETLVKIAQLQEAQKKLSATIDVGKKKKEQEGAIEYMKQLEDEYGKIIAASKKQSDIDDKAIEERKKERDASKERANSYRELIDVNFIYVQQLVEIARLTRDGHMSAIESDKARAAVIKKSNQAGEDEKEKRKKEADGYRALIDPMFEINREKEKMNLLVKSGDMSQSEADKALVVFIDKTKEATNLANDMGFAFASAFESAVLNGEKAGNAMKALGRDILQVFLRLAVTNQIINAIFGASGLGLGGKGFQPLPTIGARANGGPVSAGSPYLVGERGPELFVPKGSGAIMPNGAGGTSVNITYNIASGVSRSDLAPILEQQRKLLKAEIPDMVRRGGGYRAAFA